MIPRAGPRVWLKAGEASRVEDFGTWAASLRESTRVVNPAGGARGATRPTILAQAGVTRN